MNKHYLGIFLRGMAMGAADIVPGVSGGTMALITGIYQQLLDSLRAINPSALYIFWQQGPKAFWRTINGNFLLALLLGILTSLLSLAHIISYILSHYPILLWAFFFGLVFASACWLFKQQPAPAKHLLLPLGIGFAVAWLITSGKPVQLDITPFTMFFAGAIAISAMILPGISGSFILLLLGVYPVIIAAIKNLELGLLLFFGGGCLVGLLSFVHLLSFLLKRYYAISMAVLTGFLFGSLNALWPWKQVLSSYISSSGVEKALLQQNISPLQFELLNQTPSYWPMALGLAVLGAVCVWLLERLSQLNH